MNIFTKRIYTNLNEKISVYVNSNFNKVNHTEALVLPNHIVLLVGNGSIHMWDSHRHYDVNGLEDVDLAIEIVFEELCLWYCDNLADKVYKRQAFVTLNGRRYKTIKYNFPKDEDGYPTMSEDEMLIKFRELTKEESLWTSEEMKEILGIDWDVRTGK